jgi:GNAT superfamily N-acetyltransferase
MDRHIVAQVTIRPAVLGDTEAIGQLWLQLVYYHNTLSPDMPRATTDGGKRYARRIASRLQDIHTRVLVAEDDARIVAFVFGVIVDFLPEVFIEEVAGFVADIYVDPAYRGQGIGRALVFELADWFHQRGVQYFEWYVANQNTEGRAFWHALGGRDVMTRMRLNLNTRES